MKREELKNLGIEDEKIDEIMKFHGRTITAKNTEVENYKTQIEELKNSTKQFENYIPKEELYKFQQEQENKLKEIQNNYQKDLYNKELNYVLEKEISKHNPRDAELVKSLINKDNLKLNDGKIEYIDNIIDNIKKEKDFLFNQNLETNSTKINQKTNSENYLDSLIENIKF